MTEPVAVDIRLNEDGTLDEVVSPFFHLEQMSPTHWWMAVYDAKGDRVTVHLHARGKISANVEREGATGGTDRPTSSPSGTAPPWVWK